MSDVHTAGTETADGMPESPVFSLTDSAVRRIGEILRDEGPGMMLRVAVSGGGCSGFQYGFSFDDTRTDDDLLIERGGIKVLIDSVSVEYLRGSQLDFVEDLVGASFQVKNPNATAKCGCGSSFAI